MAISLRLGWQKDQLRPAGSGDPSATPSSVILPHRSPDSGCFALIPPPTHNPLYTLQPTHHHTSHPIPIPISPSAYLPQYINQHICPYPLSLPIHSSSSAHLQPYTTSNHVPSSPPAHHPTICLAAHLPTFPPYT